MGRLLALVAAALAAALSCGCALRASVPPAQSVAAGAEEATSALSAHIEKVRHLSQRPAATSSSMPTVEQQDKRLASALLELSAGPTADRHRTVAEHYRSLGVADAAYRHFGRALALDPRDPAAHDGLARVWRDWGYPHLALGDAHRAVFYGPDSAAARNTLGTIFQALGRHTDARRAYEEAATLEPRAAYALSNLCYLSFLQGQFDDAARACRSALVADPSSRAARNNLALAYAGAGRVDLARIEFMNTSDEALAYFNIGIMHMARRDYAAAAMSFDAASRRNPAMGVARERATQARQLHSRPAGERPGDPK